MFPTSFADAVIREYTTPGDIILDPFLGRGTSVFAAAINGRTGIGVEVNPVGWIYSRVKLHPADQHAVVERLVALRKQAKSYRSAASDLPEFFHHCFSQRVAEFLLAARDLDWRHQAIDRTLMAFLLVYLHGKREASLSNQMRQTKSMSPDYAIRWWKRAGLKPPDLDPVGFMKKRIKWRYAKGRPMLFESRAYLGDSVRTLPTLTKRWKRAGLKPVRLLFTSPPYYRVTNYHYDQWLRLWLLGGPSNALRVGGRYRGKFESRIGYEQLLTNVFQRSLPLLHREAVIYVRTDRRQFTYETTLKVLKEVFPKKSLTKIKRPFARPTQTHLFGDRSTKVGEVDLLLIP